MPLLDWNDKYKTGVHLVDTQHQELFRQINALHEAMKTGKGKEQVGKSVEFLAKYTADHFRAEEGLMAKHGYPDLAKHQGEHQALVAKVMPLVVKVKSGQMVLTIEVSDFLADWVKDHILKTDFSYVPFFKQKGVAL